MSVTWMRTDFNFGLPHKTFTLNMESELAVKFFGHMRDSESQEPEKLAQEPEKLAGVAAQVVADARPQLSGGMILLAIHADPWRHVWEFTVAHPSFPRINAGEYAPKEWLVPRASSGRKLLGTHQQAHAKARAVLLPGMHRSRPKPHHAKG